MMATSNKLEILSYNVPYSWLNFFKISCMQCSTEFSGYEKDNYHRPLLLSCSHVICGVCIGRQPMKSFKCRKCNESTYFDITREARLQTVYHHYLDGLLSFKKHVIPYRRNYLGKSRSSETLKPKKECFECGANAYLRYCVVCEVIYCTTCFNLIHKSAKALQHHRFTVPDASNQHAAEVFCKVHHNEKLSFYCKDCSETCCMKCSHDDHSTHEISSIREENMRHKHLLEHVLGLISEAQKENQTSKSKFEDFYNCHDKYLTDSTEKVTEFFIYLHGLLQNIELEYINRIKESYKGILNEINVVEATLSENEIFLTKKSDKLHSYKIETPKCVYILSELQQIERTIEHMPVSLNFKNQSVNPICCSFKEVKSFKDQIRSYIQLDIEKKLFKDFSKQILRPSSPTCDTLTQEKFDKSEISMNITSASSSTISAEVNLTTSILNEHFYKKKALNNNKMSIKPKPKVTSEMVHVSHIVNAGKFYVQNQAFLGQSQHFIEICKKEGNSAELPTEIKLNEMYLVHNLKEDAFYRGIVTLKSKVNCTVFFVDYGKCEKLVAINRLRTISQYLLKYPKAARLCSFYNITFENIKIYDQIHLMSDIIRDQLMTMITLYEEDGTNFVDLFNNCENRISLRDALLFCGTISNSNKNPKVADKIKNLEDYKKEFIYSKARKNILNNVFKIGECFKICVKHIVSPAKFYVMKTDHVDMIADMNRKLNEFCEKSPNFIYYPQVLTNCAVYGPDNLWHRGLIKKILPNNRIEVKLVDLGLKQEVDRKSLMYLDRSFTKISEGVIKCQLSDVQPQKVDNYAFSENIIQKFRELSLSTNLHVTINKIVKDKLIVVLHIILANQETCINDLLKGDDEENKYLEEMSIYRTSGISIKNFDITLKSDSKPSQPTISNSGGIKRTKINILNICSPSEIYVSLEKFLPGLKKLHINIQKLMETNKNDLKTKPNWAPYEKCFVNTKLDKNFQKQWYRGIIQTADKTDENKYVIFLRDKGCYVTEHFKHITETNDLLGNIGCGALHCALSSVRPTGCNLNWPSYAIDEFRELVNSYQEHAVTLYGEKFETGMKKCYKVILWGLSIECEDALSPAELQWNNINMILSDAGLCHLTQKFTEIEKQVELETENIANDITAYLETFEKQQDKMSGLSCDVSNLNINNTIADSTHINAQINDKNFTDVYTPIDSWLKCERIKKSQFVARPTYVDNDAVIYLHEYDAKATIDKIAKTINEKYKDSQSEPNTNLTWWVGQPCMAKYHVDNLYYRAKIVQMKSDTAYQIEFIDYGNVEDCNPCDLRRNIILGNVPIQAHKYCLNDVEPITPVWTTQILDIIHSKVVLKMCTIRTSCQSYENEELDIVPCQITVDSYDLSKFLVAHKFANFKLDNVKPTLIYERFLSHRHSDKIYNGPSVSNKPNVMERTKDKESLYTLLNDSSSDVVIIDSGESADSDADDNISFNDSNFETSTQYFQMYEFSPYRIAEIQRDVHGFHGTVIKVLSPTDIIISTKLEKSLSKYKEMMDTLQLKARTCESLKNICIGLSCIAWNEIDNLWHRGLIKGYNQTNEMFTILLVDKMDMIKVKSSHIKKCPTGCLNYPLLYLRVALNRVKPNRRLRETDITNEMSPLLVGKMFYVKIIKIKSQIPTVEFYKDNKCEDLVYQSLIDGNFLTYN